MNKIIVLDEGSVNLLERAIINEEWFDTFSIPSLYCDKLCSLKYNDIFYIFSKQAKKDSKYLIVNTGPFDGFWG